MWCALAFYFVIYNNGTRLARVKLVCKNIFEMNKFEMRHAVKLLLIHFQVSLCIFLAVVDSICSHPLQISGE